ncbi:MAG: hypothetical protein WDW38_008913 [Sanguina aurantia]
MQSKALFAVLCTMCVALATAQQDLSTGPVMTLNATVLSKSGQYVTVSWTGIHNPTPFDSVALYIVGYTPEALRPMRYQWVNTVNNAVATGAGSMTFQVLNQRADVVFYYFSNVTPPLLGPGGVFDFGYEENDLPAGMPFYFSTPHIVATSPVLKIKNYNEPTQGHLAVTMHQGEMLVQWTTRDKTTPTVQFGVMSGKYTNSAKGTYSTILPGDFCGAPASTLGYIHPGMLNYVTIKQLMPDTKYYYRYGDAKHGWSSEASFQTAPVVGRASTLRILAWADSGQVAADGSYAWDWGDYNPISFSAPNTIQGAFAVLDSTFNQDQAQQAASQNLTRMLTADILSFNPHVSFHEGDLSYARGSTAEWDQFMHQYEPVIKSAPFMTLPGNHERDCTGSNDRYSLISPRGDSGGECGVAYERRFRMPQPAVKKHWYSFDMGPAHFIQITTEDAFGVGSEQWNFVVNDLKAVNRSLTPWVIVGMHRPMYTSSLYGVEFNSDLYVGRELAQNFEEVFYKYSVDMTWNGHVHLYERTCPVLKKKCLGYNADGTAKAPVHLDFGNGGFEFTWFSNPFTPAYFEIVAMEHGYNKITINATNLHVTHYSTENGRIIDDFTLTKPVGWVVDTFHARKYSLEYLVDDYVPAGFWEWPGLSINAIWGDLFFTNAITYLANNTLLAGVVPLNLTLINNPNTQDTVSNLNQVFQIYVQLLRNPALVGNANTTIYQQYKSQVWEPLFALFNNNTHFFKEKNNQTYLPDGSGVGQQLHY